MEIEGLGLPREIVDHLRAQGIEDLYPPQETAVEAGVLEGQNLVAAVPTASGKTLIAAMAMLSCKGSALYIVPLRALASEKYEEFSGYPDVNVGISTGDYDSRDDYLGENDVVVATSEKVDSLIRNGVEWIDGISCVVVDEVHLLDSGDRGPTLEVTIAKLRRLNPDLQVVALSATVSNPDEIAGWLDAELVETDWRPVDLRRGVYADGEISFDDGSTRTVEGDTPGLVRDSVGEGGQCLVFVNSRRNSESLAKRLSEEGFAELPGLAREVREASETGTGEDLADFVEGGVAFHHAGLRSRHRALVEDGFRNRDIKVICATPTLAAGVNVPARRVVVRDHQRYSDLGMQPLPVLEVQQMFGRAGRPGLDPYGEAVLVTGSADPDELYERYVEGEPEAVYSKLASRKALRTHVLSTVASGFAGSREGLLEFLDATFYAYQEERADLGRVVDEVVDYLEGVDMVVRDDGLKATDLGHHVSRLYVDPMTGAELVDVLKNMDPDRATALTLLVEVCDTPDMYPLYLRKGEDEEMWGFAVEHEPEFWNPPSEFEPGFEDWLASLKTARVLNDWIEEEDMDDIAETYNVGPGDVHTRVERADWLLYAMESLAGLLDSSLQELVRRTRTRVTHGVKSDILELVGVRGVGRVRGRRLYDAGLESKGELREAEPDRLAELLGPKTAVNVLDELGREINDEELEARAPRDETTQSSIGDF